MSAPERPHFSSALTSVITLAGLAIGLGNLWRFPYMMGQHGGGAFLALYLVLMLVFAVPAMSAEWALGRATGHGPVGAFAAAFGRRAGRAVGALLLITLVVTASYYSLVVGNVAYSTWFAFSEGFSEETLSAYGEGLGRPG
ncbi:MAG: sodium-dependent transporter, partial [Pseudomonadota bacterium]